MDEFDKKAATFITLETVGNMILPGVGAIPGFVYLGWQAVAPVARPLLKGAKTRKETRQKKREEQERRKADERERRRIAALPPPPPPPPPPTREQKLEESSRIRDREVTQASAETDELLQDIQVAAAERRHRERVFAIMEE